jgi:phage-related minor tail protein
MRPDNTTSSVDSDETGEGDLRCKLCALWSEESARTDSRQTLRFMTDREIAVLDSMRVLKKEASRIKRRMKRMQKDLGDLHPTERTYNGRGYFGAESKLWVQGLQEDWINLSERLDRLRARWKELDLARVEAANERMRLLGHT